MFCLITQRHIHLEKGDRDSLEQAYITYFDKFSLNLLPIPNNKTNLESYFLITIKGVILSGGNDISPEFSGLKESEVTDYSEKRDDTEYRLLDLSIKKSIPVLGICRGMQIINTYFNGKLINLNERKIRESHVSVEHDVEIKEKACKKILGSHTAVNSFHNQGINKESLSPKLKVFAQTKSEIIEGIYHPDYKIAGIQWHPERKSPDDSFNEKLIRQFLEEKLYWA